MIQGLLQLLVKFVFSVILKIFDIIFSPIIAVLMALFPDISSFFNTMIIFLTNNVAPYVSFGMSWICNTFAIPRPIVVVFVSYLIFLFTAKLTWRAIVFALSVYQKLKP